MNTGDTIYYLREDRLHSAPILSKIIVENLHDDWASNDDQKTIFTHYGSAGTRFYTCHGEVHENEAYASPEKLFKGLLEGSEK
jgi:hypothetical protein